MYLFSFKITIKFTCCSPSYRVCKVSIGLTRMKSVDSWLVQAQLPSNKLYNDTGSMFSVLSGFYCDRSGHSEGGERDQHSLRVQRSRSATSSCD